MTRFSKVSKEQFVRDAKAMMLADMDEAFIEDAWENIQLPTRSTDGAAGYDIRTPFSFDFKSSIPFVIPTGIRIEMPKEKFLAIVPRSGLGFKYGMRLENSIGVIDSDYFYSTNEGHIMLKINCNKDFSVNAGDRIAQGIILNYFTTDDDEACGKRDGGFGSTGR